VCLQSRLSARKITDLLGKVYDVTDFLDVSGVWKLAGRVANEQEHPGGAEIIL
jgi:hypothetical protein